MLSSLHYKLEIKFFAFFFTHLEIKKSLISIHCRGPEQIELYCHTLGQFCQEGKDINMRGWKMKAKYGGRFLHFRICKEKLRLVPFYHKIEKIWW